MKNVVLKGCRTFFKSLFFATLILVSKNACSQSYKSYFGKNTTSWNVLSFSGLEDKVTDSIFVSGDTILQGNTWKKIKYAGRYNYTAYLKEDTAKGILYYKSFPTSSPQISSHMNLKIGDTLPGPQPYMGARNIIIVIDVTYDTLGRKEIIFDFINIDIGENLKFIEGVGANMGPRWIDTSKYRETSPLLLCKEKDGKSVYTGTEEGYCRFGLNTGLPESLFLKQLAIYPNPFSDILNIDTQENNVLLKVIVYDLFGQIVYSSTLTPSQRQIYLGDLNKQLYFLKILDSKTSRELANIKIIKNH